jgi:hypothetical protein
MEIQDKKAPILAIIGAGKEILSATLLKYKEFYKDQPEDQQIVLLVDRDNVEDGVKPVEYGWGTVKELSEALEDGRLLDFQKRVEAGPTQKTIMPIKNVYEGLDDSVGIFSKPIGDGKHSNKKYVSYNKAKQKRKAAKKARKKNRK